MNKTIASYLANVATAAEHAPYGVPGLFQANAFMNNGLVWAANSVVTAQKRFDVEPTADNEERIEKATVRLHTIKALYDQYAEDVAIPKLEMPHVERFMGLDKEPDVTEIANQAANAAKAAVRNALLAGRNPKGVYAKEYAIKTAAMAKVREERRAALNDVYGLVHTDADEHYYDESEVENFTERMHDKFMSIARANWMYASDALTDVSLRTFNVEKYNRLAAAQAGCRAFMQEFGITDTALADWRKHLDAFVASEVAEFATTEAELDAAVAAEQAAFEGAERDAIAKAKAEKTVRRVVKNSKHSKDAAEATLARKEEDTQLQLQ